MRVRWCVLTRVIVVVCFALVCGFSMDASLCVFLLVWVWMCERRCVLMCVCVCGVCAEVCAGVCVSLGVFLCALVCLLVCLGGRVDVRVCLCISLHLCEATMCGGGDGGDVRWRCVY